IAAVFGVPVFCDNSAGQHASKAFDQASISNQVRDGNSVVQYLNRSYLNRSYMTYRSYSVTNQAERIATEDLDGRHYSKRAAREEGTGCAGTRPDCRPFDERTAPDLVVVVDGDVDLVPLRRGSRAATLEGLPEGLR